MYLLECSRVEKRTKVRKLEPPGTLIWPPYLSDEDRYITIGSVNGTVLILMVVYTERGDAVRIISARKATSQERRRYYDHDES